MHIILSIISSGRRPQLSEYFDQSEVKHIEMQKSQVNIMDLEMPVSLSVVPPLWYKLKYLSALIQWIEMKFSAHSWSTH